MVLLLGLGALVAAQVGALLGLSDTVADVPVEQPVAAPAREDVAPPEVSRVVVPDEPSVQLAARSVAAAYAARGLAVPQVVVSDDTRGPCCGVVATIDPAAGLDGEQFRLEAGAGVHVVAGTAAGARAGLSTIADRVRSAVEVVPDDEIDQVQAPRLGLRLTDVGAVGLDDDPARFAVDDYSLNSDVVGQAVLPDAPWVDQDAVREIEQQFHALVDHAAAQGYNGVVVQGFLEYVTFADVGVYPQGDPHVARAEAMVRAFGPVWRYAHDMGMKVYLMTDMLAVDPPLEAYLERTVGGLDTTSPELWSVYQAGLQELFTSMPFLDGLMVRIGEGGSAYQLPGWDYSSKVAVTTPQAVRAMLRAFLETAGGTGRDVIFRSWTVGLGAVGDLHTNPDSYDEVLGGLDDPHLVVSTKIVAGDFYSHLPINPTLRVGDQRRIVEVQARREFEGQGALPDDLGDLMQRALVDVLAANPHVEGVWNWSQTGGPLYAGPRALYLRDGFWQLWDLNSYLAARLAADPDASVPAARADWVRQTFSADPDTVAAISKAYALSREAITQGLYIGPFADKSVKALGLEPPPMMWIFEWDIVSGDSATFDSIYAFTRGRVDEAVAEGHAAVATAARMRDLIAGTSADSWLDAGRREAFLAALDYQHDLLVTLDAYRETVLRHAQWLDTGSAEARAASRAAQVRFADARAAHDARYGDDLALPAFNFTAADLGLDRADRGDATTWAARGLLLVTLTALALGAWSRRPRFPGHRALGLLWTGGTRPWRLTGAEDRPGLADRVVLVALPAFALLASRAAYGWFLAPVHVVITVGAWLVFALVVCAFGAGRRAWWALLAAVGGVALLRTALLLAVLSWRGPGRYWFGFWTLPGQRAVYVTVAFAAFCWLFVASWCALRSAYRLSVRDALGAVVGAVGVVLAVGGGVVAAIGLETVLSAWNDQLALLPWGLHRILGLCVYLGIPESLPLGVALVGVAAVAVGTLLRVPLRRVRRDA